MQKQSQTKATPRSDEGKLGRMNPAAKYPIMLIIIVLVGWCNAMQWGWWTPSWDVSSAMLWTLLNMGAVVSLVVLKYFMGDTKATA